jgi:hypothetical protein
MEKNPLSEFQEALITVILAKTAMPDITSVMIASPGQREDRKIDLAYNAGRTVENVIKGKIRITPELTIAALLLLEGQQRKLMEEVKKSCKDNSERYIKNVLSQYNLNEEQSDLATLFTDRFLEDLYTDFMKVTKKNTESVRNACYLLTAKFTENLTNFYIPVIVNMPFKSEAHGLKVIQYFSGQTRFSAVSDEDVKRYPLKDREVIERFNTVFKEQHDLYTSLTVYPSIWEGIYDGSYSLK